MNEYCDELYDDVIESQFIGIYENEIDDYSSNQLYDYCDELYEE